MKSTVAEALLNKIDLSIQDIRSFQGMTPLQESYFARFLVVFTCGIYEEAIETIVNEWVLRLGSPEISRYISKSLYYGFQNPKVKKLSGLLKDFNPAWKTSINSLPQVSRDALDSIVDDKNALAHGNTCNITLNDAIKYYTDSRIIVETIDNVVL